MAVGGAGVPPGMGIGAGIPPGMNVSVAGAPSGFSGPPPGYANAHPGNLGLNPVPNQQATRHARRVYVGNLPATVTEPKLSAFFNNAMHAIGGTVAALSGQGEPVLNVYINYEKKFAFVEFRTVEETSNCMALDGVVLEGVAMGAQAQRLECHGSLQPRPVPTQRGPQPRSHRPQPGR